MVYIVKITVYSSQIGNNPNVFAWHIGRNISTLSDTELLLKEWILVKYG